VNPDRERALMEVTRRSPFWVCLLVFGLLAADNAFRLADFVRVRGQLNEAERVQKQNIGRLREVLTQAPQVEAKLQALSLGLIELAKTNAKAAQIVRDFNIQWNPGRESFLTPSAPPRAIPAPRTPASATATPAKHPRATNAPAAK